MVPETDSPKKVTEMLTKQPPPTAATTTPTPSKTANSRLLLHKLIKNFAWFVTVVSFFVNLYIYTYPSLNPEACSWKHQYKNTANLAQWQQQLLDVPYLGDLYSTYFISEDPLLKPQVDDVRLMAIGDPQINGNWPSTKYIKRLDNYGNDYYLGHIYKVMKPRLQPSHVVVMGDLFSSQWISDSEFYNRTKRYMTRLFPRPSEQTQVEIDFLNEHNDVDWQSHYHFFREAVENGTFLQSEWYHYNDVYDWTSANLTNEPLFINISGNHDIGYGDTTYQHMARWRKLFEI
ncbi:unnamed protein product [Ambrosiozyma monospora]|uniref:Unnamed protein product n=1 Tax=Ambrosiozyma monospora TaxID=43982 RepID=A0A9W6Z313_AMBMO|nr:unnamed protein product [Ambrosiozyma monospora]